MKILHTEASAGWGGQEIRTLREAMGMRERGHIVIIAAHPESVLLLKAGKENLRTVPLDFKRRNFLYITGFLKKFIEKEKIDVVNTHSSKDSWLALPAARLARNRPLVLRTRHLSTPVHRGGLNRILYGYLPHCVMTTGKAIREQLIRQNGFPADKIISVPTGVDISIFNSNVPRGALRTELALPEDTPLIGMVSVLRSWKGHIHMINSVPAVIREKPQARFVIAGDGPYRPTIEKALNSLHLEKYIYFLGHREDVSMVMSSLDVLVHPSYASEGVPQSVLQAMAMEIPVIASDLAALGEIVQDGVTGLTFPLSDPGMMASKILSLLDNKEESGRMCKNARMLVEREHSYAGMLDRIESLYFKGVSEW